MGKRLAIGVGVLAAVVLASFGGYLLFNWKAVATEYHFRRLARDPEHLARILDSPEGTSKQAAVQRYIAEPEGAQHVLRLYVSALLSVLDSRARTFRDTDRFVLQYDQEGGVLGREGVAVWASQSRSTIFDMHDDRLSLLHRIVQERRIANYEGIELKGLEGLVFQVVRGPWAWTLSGLKGFSSRWLAERYVCIGRGKNAPDPAPAEPIAVPFLLAALGSEVPGESELAREALVTLGCDPDDPLTYLLSRDHVSVAALSVVDAKHVPRIIDALEDADSAARRILLQALIRRELEAETAIPVYLDAARDEDVEVRDTAVEGLEALGSEGIPALLRLLDGGPERLHFRALNAIGRLGARAKPAIPDMLAWGAGHSNPHMRRKVAEVVLEMDRHNQQALAIVRELEEETASR